MWLFYLVVEGGAGAEGASGGIRGVVGWEEVKGGGVEGRDEEFGIRDGWLVRVRAMGGCRG